MVLRIKGNNYRLGILICNGWILVGEMTLFPFSLAIDY